MLGLILVALGCVFFGISLLGVYRLPTILGRIHAAGIGETFAPLLTLVGLMLLRQEAAYMAKIGCVLGFLWLSSPVSSHLIGYAALHPVKDEKWAGGDSDAAD